MLEMVGALTRWQDFACRFPLPPEEASAVYVQLEGRYGEPHRHYHILAHVLDMLDGRDALGADGYALEAAIWFHDVIYDPRSGENERRSAEYAAGAFSSVADAQFHADLERLILITDHRTTPERDDERVLCDLDLMILGRNEESYRAYTEAVRKEFAHVPDELFNRARRAVVEACLERPVIYYTEAMRGQFEETARENLRRELGSLPEA